MWNLYKQNVRKNGETDGKCKERLSGRFVYIIKMENDSKEEDVARYKMRQEHHYCVPVWVSD